MCDLASIPNLFNQLYNRLYNYIYNYTYENDYIFDTDSDSDSIESLFPHYYNQLDISEIVEIPNNSNGNLYDISYSTYNDYSKNLINNMDLTNSELKLIWDDNDNDNDNGNTTESENSNYKSCINDENIVVKLN